MLYKVRISLCCLVLVMSLLISVNFCWAKAIVQVSLIISSIFADYTNTDVFFKSNSDAQHGYCSRADARNLNVAEHTGASTKCFFNLKVIDYETKKG